MQRRHQVFGALLAPAHARLQVACDCRDDELFAQQCNLLAKAAAHVGRHDGDLGFRQSKSAGQPGAKRMRGLDAHMHGEMPSSAVPHRDAAARLQRHVGLAMLREPAFDHAVRRGELPVYVAGRERLPRDEVARQGIVHQDRRGRGGRHVDDGFEWRIVDRDPFGRRSGGVHGCCDHAGDRIAHEPDLVDGHHRHRGRLQALDRGSQA